MFNKFWFNRSFTVKFTIILCALLCGSMVLFVGARHALAASLKPVTIISDDTLKLSDLFDGLKQNANYVIGPAPQPGQEIVLNARTLYRIAVALDMPWRPISSSDQVVIKRAATLVPYSVIERTLRNELETKGVSGKYNIALNSGEPSVTLPDTLPQNAEVTFINYDPRKDFFQAMLAFPSRDNPVKKINVTGMVDRMISVPVLRSNLKNGDIIGKNDIDMIDVPQKNLQPGIIMDKEKVIGLTPRRIGYAGKYIMAGSLERPQLVERGEKVNITFREGPLLLSAKGKALQSGAKGDFIRVTNINSSRTIDAQVTGENQVLVQ